MKRLLLTFAAAVTVQAMQAQETGFRDFGDRVDSKPVPAGPLWLDADIETWEPTEEFADEMHPEPAISMSSMMKVGSDASRRVVVMPNNALRLWWRLEISNGSAGNWGNTLNSYLDARTLSFPTR